MMRCNANRQAKLIRWFSSEKGLTITEYAVAAGLIAATMTVAFLNLGLTIDAIILAVMAFM